MRWSLLVLAACGRIDFDPRSLPALVVAPTYPQAAAWTDHVRWSDPTLPRYRQSGVPCDGTGPCLHAGVQRMAVVSGATSCDGVVATDALGALQWTCDDSSGMTIVYATGLRAGAGLADLVDSGGFRANTLHVVTPIGVADSSAGVWWTDPVVPLPPNASAPSIALDQPGTIYLQASSAASGGYQIVADHVAVVVARGATLSASPVAGNCDFTGPVGGMACEIVAGAHRYLWLEGELDGARAVDLGVLLVGTSYSQLRRLHVASAVLEGIDLYQASSNTGIDLVGTNCGQYGLVLTLASANTLYDVRAFDNGVENASGFTGVIIGDSAQNTLVGVTAANNYPYGILLYGSAANDTLSHVTVANNAFAGLDLQGAGATAVVNVLSVNDPTGVRFDSVGNIGAQLATGNGEIGVCANDGTGMVVFNVVSGMQTFGDCRAGTMCDVPIACDAVAGSPIYTGGLDARAAVVGKVTGDDSANASDSAGQAAQAAITDWLHFDNPLRGWGADGAAFPDTTNQHLCVAGSACRIWDWGHAAGDQTIATRDATGATSAAGIVPGAPCPAAADGNFAVTDTIGNTFLVNAIELVGDGLGDDDGLCESDEACLYSQVFGADQGGFEPAPGTCVFRDGTVHGVRLYGR